MAWIDHVVDRRGIDAIFPHAPSLANIRLIEVTLQEDGPTIRLRFDLNEYPDKPPQKWVQQKCNRVQLSFRLSGYDWRMSGWDLNNIGDLTLAPAGGGIDVRFKTPLVEFSCRTDFVFVDRISAYCCEEPLASD